MPLTNSEILNLLQNEEDYVKIIELLKALNFKELTLEEIENLKGIVDYAKVDYFGKEIIGGAIKFMFAFAIFIGSMAYLYSNGSSASLLYLCSFIGGAELFRIAANLPVCYDSESWPYILNLKKVLEEHEKSLKNNLSKSKRVEYKEKINYPKNDLVYVELEQLDYLMNNEINDKYKMFAKICNEFYENIDNYDLATVNLVMESISTCFYNLSLEKPISFNDLKSINSCFYFVIINECERHALELAVSDAWLESLINIKKEVSLEEYIVLLSSFLYQKNSVKEKEYTRSRTKNNI